MRLTDLQRTIIRVTVAETFGAGANVWLFGSRVNDNQRGGDIDLLVEIPHVVESPAWLNARISGRISYLPDGQKVDVILLAPNLERFPIHEIAEKEGVMP